LTGTQAESGAPHAGWPAEFEQILREVLPAPAADEPVPADRSLTELGLDSISIVSLIIRVEADFGVELDERLDDRRLFSSAAYLWGVIMDLREPEGDEERA
jgi:acyl carrier protein